jgi:hypothetical protein
MGLISILSPSPPETRAGATAISEVIEVSEVTDFFSLARACVFSNWGMKTIMFEGTAGRMENH